MQKRIFLKELNQKDPHWQDKIKQRQMLELKRMEQARDKMKRDINDRQKKLEQDKAINTKFQNLK